MSVFGDNIKIKHDTWDYPPPPGQPDYRNQMRWILIVDGLVIDHYATEMEAQAEAAEFEKDGY
jgi:hypothetical protein